MSEIDPPLPPAPPPPSPSPSPKPKPPKPKPKLKREALDAVQRALAACGVRLDLVQSRATHVQGVPMIHEELTWART
jgi:hypothetical protein